MSEDFDIWRHANALLKEHGETAWFEAGMREDHALDEDDMDGARCGVFDAEIRLGHRVSLRDRVGAGWPPDRGDRVN